MWQHDDRNWAAEMKYADAPRLTRSMQSALIDLAHLWIVYPGNRSYPQPERVTAIPLARVAAAWPSPQPTG